jgi:hypothetical protein
VKRFSVHKAPLILTLQLKRFDAIRLNKISKDVSFPETLNLRPYMSVKQVGIHVDRIGQNIKANWVILILQDNLSNTNFSRL